MSLTDILKTKAAVDSITRNTLLDYISIGQRAAPATAAMETFTAFEKTGSTLAAIYSHKSLIESWSKADALNKYYNIAGPGSVIKMITEPAVSAFAKMAEYTKPPTSYGFINNALESVAAMHRHSSFSFFSDMDKMITANKSLSFFQNWSALKKSNIHEQIRSYKIPDESEAVEENEFQHEGLIIHPKQSTYLLSLIQSVYTNDATLTNMTPREFEKMVAELLGYHGYDVRLTKQTRDGGFDMSITRICEDGRPFKAVVECKRYRGKIGVEFVRSLSAVAYREKANGGIIVTSSTFTRDAVKECHAGMPSRISLKDKKDVANWAGSYLGKMPVIDLGLESTGVTPKIITS